jgi:hypothetical protein
VESSSQGDQQKKAGEDTSKVIDLKTLKQLNVHLAASARKQPILSIVNLFMFRIIGERRSS